MDNKSIMESFGEFRTMYKNAYDNFRSEGYSMEESRDLAKDVMNVLFGMAAKSFKFDNTAPEPKPVRLPREANLKDLLGKTLTDVTVNDDKDVIIFTCSDGTAYRMYHEQDCCEYVSIEDICGDLNSLIGSPITLADDLSNLYEDQPAIEEYVDSYTWTFYHLATVKGYVTIRWYGESNGYYSESVDFEQIK